MSFDTKSYLKNVSVHYAVDQLMRNAEASIVINGKALTVVNQTFNMDDAPVSKGKVLLNAIALFFKSFSPAFRKNFANAITRLNQLNETAKATALRLDQEGRDALVVQQAERENTARINAAIEAKQNEIGTKNLEILMLDEKLFDHQVKLASHKEEGKTLETNVANLELLLCLMNEKTAIAGDKLKFLKNKKKVQDKVTSLESKINETIAALKAGKVEIAFSEALTDMGNSFLVNDALSQEKNKLESYSKDALGNHQEYQGLVLETQKQYVEAQKACQKLKKELAVLTGPRV